MASQSDAPNLKIRDEVTALKRERTIGAAVDLFYELGYENTTLDAVAEQLGVTKPFIYANFGAKGELLAEICSRGIASSLEAIDSVLELRASPTVSLTELSRRFATAVLESQKHIAIYTREEKNLAPGDAHRIGEMRRGFDAKLTKLLEKGMASGEFDLEDARVAALAIGGMVSWAYVWYRPRGRLTVSEIAERMTKLILALAGIGRDNGEKKPRPRRARAR
jgi:AcrR family transcriptional regulator